MAIVKDAANNGGAAKDKPLTSANRTVAAEPNGTETPQFAGEIVYDSTNDCLWKATNVDNAHWVMLTPPGP